MVCDIETAPILYRKFWWGVIEVLFNMSAVDSLLSFLSKGNTVTVKQARTMFKVQNVSDLVYRLRSEGVSVYTNRATTSRGEKVYAYRLGTPSEQFLKYLDQGHIARARKTLYRDAIAVKMAP